MLTVVLLSLAVTRPATAAAKFRHLSMEDGLSANIVFNFVQDSRGYMWITTENGLNRYDGYTFKIFEHNSGDPNTPSGTLARALHQDSQGRIWLGTFSNGLDVYDPSTGSFRHFHHVPGDPNTIASDSIWSLGSLPDGRLLIGTYDAGLDILDATNGTVKHFPANSGPAAPANNRINNIYVDHSGHVWLCTSTGLDEFDPSGIAATRHFSAQAGKTMLPVWQVAEDPQHRLWMATQGGLFVLDPGAAAPRAVTEFQGMPPLGTYLRSVVVDADADVWFAGAGTGVYLIRRGNTRVQHFGQDADNTDELTSNHVWSLYQDQSGIIWIATTSGIDLIDPRTLDLAVIHPQDVRGGTSETANQVLSIAEYRGQVLMGSLGAIYEAVISDDGTAQAKLFMDMDKNKYGEITALSVAKDDLYIGSEWGYLLRRGPTGSAQTLMHYAIGTKGREIHHIIPIGDHKLYMGTFGNGLVIYDTASGKTTHVEGDTPTELHTNDIVEDLLPTGGNTLWVGTFRGLFKVDTDDNKASLVPMTPGNIEPVVQGLYLDKHHNLWIATYDGLWSIALDARGDAVSKPTAIPEFSHMQVLSIEQDDGGNLWMATINSLIRFNPASGEMLRFGRDQGSPIAEYFSYGHAHASDGRLWFGGGQGAIGFLPGDLKPNRHAPAVTLNTATTYRDGSLITTPLAKGGELTLTYHDRISTFDVAAMDFGAPQANTYSYRLVGFTPQWTPPSRNHLITFTNLSPGRYRLEVKAANNWGTWSTSPTTLDLIVLPPWWRTWWAYTIYLLIVIGSAIAYVYSLKRKITREKAVSASLREANEIKSNFVEKLEVQVKEATQELRETLQGVNLKNAELEIAQRRATEGEQVKSQFLANMSHELRTPLTGVLGYTKLLHSTNLNSEQKDYVGTIRQSSEALLAIINDTLDLSRLEAGKLLIDEVDFDLLELIESTLELLAPIAYQKRLELIRVIPPEAPLQLRGDPLRMRQVFTNLLSNAIKFTESGSVCLEVRVLEQTERDATVAFHVTDTGIGIPEGEIGQLFNAYVRGRISTRHHVEGTGLGLNICKKLLDLMGGQIGVESRVGTGTTFHFQVKFRLQKHVAPRQQLAKKLSILLYDKHPMSNAAWKASLTRLGADVREVAELESLIALQAEAAVLSLSERELAHLGELKQKFSPALPPMLILAPRIDRQTLKDLSETLYHRVLSKTAREKTVYLELQSLVQHAIHTPEAAAESKPANVVTASKPAADAPLVLVADDNRINRRLLVTMLSQSGFRTAEAGNGIELLDLAARGGWQAALLDIHMPGMDGIETATRLRVIYGEMTPPIIAMSADVLPGGQGGPQQGLMDDFLMKPFNEHQLIELLRTHIERRRQGRTAG
ncbi:MAG TPA: two-component regulator propeller domain-containing protein [Gammaproteobacteria bacterium]|nr:two-component regulator propeller domain-containing protein [Gammaproteobacteria bacterium]